MRLAAGFSLVTWLCVFWPAITADKPLVVELWPGKVPDEAGNIGAEKIVMSPVLDRKQVEVTESTRMVTNVSRPTITIYHPAKDKDTGTAMLICPGGGYWNLYWQLEGEEVAAWLNSLGVTGIILKYRVPRRPDFAVLCYSGYLKAKDKDKLAPGLRIPAELHVYATAAHDFGVRRSDHPCSTWTQSVPPGCGTRDCSSRPGANDR